MRTSRHTACMNRHPSSVRTLRPPTLRNTTPNNLSGTGYSGQNPAKNFPSHSQTVKIRGSGYSTHCFSARKSAGHTVVANRPASTKAGNFRRKTPTSSLPGLSSQVFAAITPVRFGVILTLRHSVYHAKPNSPQRMAAPKPRNRPQAFRRIVATQTNHREIPAASGHEPTPIIIQRVIKQRKFPLVFYII